MTPSHIDFAVWAPDEATFWASWVAAGICTEPGVLAARYQGVECSALMGWPGIIMKSQPVYDGDGKLLQEAVVVPGWHCNVRVTGDLVHAFTAGLEQTGPDGLPLPIWDRTWAEYVFPLTEQPADPETGFPAGYRSAQGVTYADAADIKSPSCARQ